MDQVMQFRLRRVTFLDVLWVLLLAQEKVTKEKAARCLARHIL